jgi:hypothetical protein
MWTVISSSDTAEPSRHRLRDGVILVIGADGSGRLIDLDGEAFAIGVSATAMLQGALSAPLDAACDELARRFAVDVHQVRSDMQAFLTDLRRRGLVSAPGSARGRAGVAVGAFAWLIAPALAPCAWSPTRALAPKAWVLLALAHASTRLFGWPRTLRVWQAVTRRTERRDPGARDRATLLDAIEAAVMRALARFPLAVSCKERALACHALARAIGADCRVVLGVDLFPFALHCWCAANDRILADRREGHCERFTPVVVYA